MRISFIVIIREHADTLEACLQGVLGAAGPGDEVILVDEHSQDASRMVIAMAPRQLRRDHPLHGKIEVPGPLPRQDAAHSHVVKWRPMRLGARPRAGLAVAANAGLSMATGDAVIVLSGKEQLDPAGISAARATLKDSGADIVLGRFSGAYCDDERPHWNRQHSDQSAAVMLEAQPSRMMLRRDFMQAEGLRFTEGPFMLEEHLFHWRACLRARHIRLLDRVVSYAQQVAQEAPQDAETLSVVFAHFQRIALMLTPDGPHAALREWLARMVGRHLTALPPMDYWVYAAAADPSALAGEWPGGRGGRALAALSNRPLWQAVALWQSEAIWADLAGQAADDAPVVQDPGAALPAQAANRAIALWRGMRSATSSAGVSGPDNASA